MRVTSACGTKRTSQMRWLMSAFEGTADIEHLPDGQITCAIFRPPCQSPFAKIFLFFRNPNQPYMFAILSH